MHAEALGIMADMIADFNKTTKTWKHNVDFKGVVKDEPEQISVSTSTNDKIYGYVDQGTRPHIIKPKKAKALFFASKFKPKTKPHVINSTQGQQGERDTHAMVVHHPGTDARYFARDIQAKYQPILKSRMEKAITKAARESGHSSK